MKLPKKFIGMILTKIEPEECIQKFDKIYAKKSHHALVRFFRMLLNASIKHSHPDLMEILLNDPRCNLNTIFANIPIPIYIVVKTTDLQLMDVFLRECSSVDVTKRYKQMLFADGKLVVRDWSALEYACCFDGLEMLGKLVSYDIEKKKEIAASSPQLARPGCLLHHLMSLLGESNPYTAEYFNLPEIIKLMISRGVDVDELNDRNQTSLDLLIQKVERITAAGITKSTEHHRLLFTDAAKLLLMRSGTDQQLIGSMIYRLLTLTDRTMKNFYLWGARKYNQDENSLALIAELIKLFLSYVSVPLYYVQCNGKGYPFHVTVVIHGACITEARRKRKKRGLAVDDVIYDEMLNSLSDMFRYLLFNTIESDCGNTFPVDDELFINTFIAVAGYCSEPNHSSRLVELILTSMSLNELRYCYDIVFERLTGMANTNEEYFALRQAFRWLKATIGVSGHKPYSLKHLARHQILRSFPYSVLVATFALGLPEALQEYVLSYNAGFTYC